MLTVWCSTRIVVAKPGSIGGRNTALLEREYVLVGVRHATERARPDTRDETFMSTRCAAAPERSSKATGQAVARSRARPASARAKPRSLHAPRRTDADPTPSRAQ